MRVVALVACLLSVTSVARAQGMDEDDSASMNMGVGMPGMGGMNIQIDVNGGKKKGGGRVEAKQKRREEMASSKPGETFKVVYEDSDDGRAGFVFLQPEGLYLEISGNGQRFKGEIPFGEPELQPGNWYKVEIWKDTNTFAKPLFSRNFEAKAGMKATFWITITGPAPTVAVAVAPPAPPPPAPAMAPARPTCMAADDLEGIKEAIESEGFSDGKVNVLKSAISDRYICVSQVVQLLELYAFSDDKIAALRAMAPAISDSQNRFKIYSALTFDSDKQAAKKILER